MNKAKRFLTTFLGVFALLVLIFIIYVLTAGNFFSPSLWFPQESTGEADKAPETGNEYYYSGSHKYYTPEAMEKDKVITTSRGEELILYYQSTTQNEVIGPLYLYSDGYKTTYLFDSENNVLDVTIVGSNEPQKDYSSEEKISVDEAAKIAETYVYIKESQYDYDNMVMCGIESDELCGAYHVNYHSTCGEDNAIISWHCKVTVNFDGGIRYFTYIDADYFETLDYGIVKDVSSRHIEDFVRGSLAGVYDGEPIILQSRLSRRYPEYFVVVTVELNGKVKGLSDIANRVFYDTTGDTTTAILSFSVGC